jgi:hypothetical protein
MKHLKQNGDGFVVNIPATEITEITGHLESNPVVNSNLARRLLEVIEEDIRLTA